MPRVFVVADLHLDLWRHAERTPLRRNIFGDIDLLILAGDLSNDAEVEWPKTFDKIGASISADRVYVFPGNHDYYYGLLDRDDLLKGTADAIGVRFAQTEEILLGSRRFLCCTLWTDMFSTAEMPDRAHAEAEEMMNDYHRIRISSESKRRARASDTVAIHHEHRKSEVRQLWVGCERSRGGSVTHFQCVNHRWMLFSADFV